MFSSVATFCAPIRINPCTALPSLLLRVRRSVLPTEWEERPPPRRVSLAACGLHFIQTILRRQMISVADTKTRDPGDFSSSSRKWRLPPLPRCISAVPSAMLGVWAALPPLSRAMLRSLSRAMLRSLSHALSARLCRAPLPRLPLCARLRLYPRYFSLYKFPHHASPYTSHFFIQVSVLACINSAQFLSISPSFFYTSLPLAIPRASDAFFYQPHDHLSLMGHNC